MPELPEVEVVKRGLEPLLCGRIIQSCKFSGKSLRLPVSSEMIYECIVKGKVRSIWRRAKYIVIEMDTAAKMIVHLGMTGKLGMFKKGAAAQTHDHVCFSLDDGMELRFNDVRRFGSIQVVSSEEEVEKFFQEIGPEPFEEAFSVEYLKEKAKKRGQPIKNFIMDSRVVAGIGNIYANEILFESGLRPDKPAGKLKVSDWKRFVTNTRSVLKRAIAAGGSTIADFVGSSGQKGYFQLQLNVYGKKGDCPACGKSIVRTVMAGRATYFCKKCQK